ncbi:hypothetical protein ANRL4_04830 [Anaerolineae bacterium]|nr:hypothetical protein ANRL4_04830 [Anaerolineae bacterium]
MKTLSGQELKFIVWYRTLTTLERLAVNYWLTTGDSRLIAFLREHSERLQRFSYQSLPDCLYQSPLHRG